MNTTACVCPFHVLSAAVSTASTDHRRPAICTCTHVVTRTIVKLGSNDAVNKPITTPNRPPITHDSAPLNAHDSTARCIIRSSCVAGGPCKYAYECAQSDTARTCSTPRMSTGSICGRHGGPVWRPVPIIWFINVMYADGSDSSGRSMRRRVCCSCCVLTCVRALTDNCGISLRNGSANRNSIRCASLGDGASSTPPVGADVICNAYINALYLAVE
jgi:hypothetical protein